MEFSREFNPYAADTDMLTVGDDDGTETETEAATDRGSASRIYTRAQTMQPGRMMIRSGRASIRDALREMMSAVRAKTEVYGIQRVVESTSEEQAQALWKADDVAWFWLATGESNARPLGRDDIIRMHTATIRRMLDNESFASAKKQMDLTELPHDPKKNVLYEQWASERSPTDIVWAYVRSHLPGANAMAIKPGSAYYTRDNDNNNNRDNNSNNNNEPDPFHMVLNSMTMYAYMVAMNPSAYGTHVRTLLSGAYQYALTHALIVQSLGIDADTYVDTHITRNHRPYVRDVLSRDKVMSAVVDFNSAEKDTPDYKRAKLALVRALESTRLAKEVKSVLERSTMDTESETPFKNLFGMYKALVILLAMVKLIQVDSYHVADTERLMVYKPPAPPDAPALPGLAPSPMGEAKDVISELGRWDTRTMHDRELLYHYAPKLGAKVRKALRKVVAAHKRLVKYEKIIGGAPTSIETRNAAKMGCVFEFASTKFLLRTTYMFLLTQECDKANESKKSELSRSAMFAVGADAAMRAYKATSAELKRKYVLAAREIGQKLENGHADHFMETALAHIGALHSTYNELLESSHPSKRHADFPRTAFGETAVEEYARRRKDAMHRLDKKVTATPALKGAAVSRMANLLKKKASSGDLVGTFRKTAADKGVEAQKAELLSSAKSDGSWAAKEAGSKHQADARADDLKGRVKEQTDKLAADYTAKRTAIEDDFSKIGLDPKSKQTRAALGKFEKTRLGGLLRKGSDEAVRKGAAWTRADSKIEPYAVRLSKYTEGDAGVADWRASELATGATLSPGVQDVYTDAITKLQKTIDACRKDCEEREKRGEKPSSRMRSLQCILDIIKSARKSETSNGGVANFPDTHERRNKKIDVYVLQRDKAERALHAATHLPDKKEKQKVLEDRTRDLVGAKQKTIFDAVNEAKFYMHLLGQGRAPLKLLFGDSLDQTHSRTESTVKMLHVFFLTGIYRTLDVLDDRVKLVLFPLDAEPDARTTEKRNEVSDDMTGYEMQADELRDTLLRYIQMLRKEVLLTTAVEEYEGAERISTDDVAAMLIRRTKALIRTVQMHLHSIPEGIVFVAAQHSSHVTRAMGEEKKPWPTGAALSLKPILDDVDDEDWYGRSSEIVSELNEKEWTLKADYDVKGTYVSDELNTGRVKYTAGVMGPIENVEHNDYTFPTMEHRKRTVPKR
jgi:hypothetical protein